VIRGRRIHVALGVPDVAASVADYSRRLGCRPSVVVPAEYALWRTDGLNLSIRRTAGRARLRHLGFEDPAARSFTKDLDVNGITWELFTASEQLNEIFAAWPAAAGKRRAAQRPNVNTSRRRRRPR
jgi:catechol 2,3-dioxygenase-like lactoylglutathione lyase family enzyme